MPRAAWASALGVAIFVAAGLRVRADDVNAILDRVEARVAHYYASAQSIIAEETVRIQNESRNMSPEGIAQVFTYETRMEMAPAVRDSKGPVAVFSRRLIKVRGAPKPGSKKKPDECTTNGEDTPTPEPLVDLLPEYRSEFDFSIVDRGARVDGRPSIVLEYRARAAGTPTVKWTKDCLSYDLPRSFFRTRVWVDAETSDVLRIDELVNKGFEIEVPRDQPVASARNSRMTLETFSTSTRYQAVRFHDPEETIVLPRTSEQLVGWNAVVAPRTRTTQSFSNYRRFVGQSRIVPPPVAR